jgi:hypothetical protein
MYYSVLCVAIIIMNRYKYTALLEQFSDHFQLNNNNIIIVRY